MKTPTLERMRQLEGQPIPDAWADDAVDLLDNWRERSAIMQYDGNMSRAQAEMMSYAIVTNKGDAP